MKTHLAQGTIRRAGFGGGEKALALTGLLGFILAGMCAVWVMLYGGPVAPGGDVMKAFSFNAALGIFLLSTAVISPFSAMSAKGRAIFHGVYIMLALYSYAAENIQNFRGVNPRFVKGGSVFDQAVGNGFAFVALLLVVCYVVLAVQFFRRRAYALRPELVLGIRYAMIATVLSFAAGVWISVNQGRFTGAHGNIIWLHGLGFHALQAIPLVAWLTERTTLAASARRRLIHIAGVTYLLGLAAVGSQTLDGRALLEWSALPVAGGVLFLISIGTGAMALLRSAGRLREA